MCNSSKPVWHDGAAASQTVRRRRAPIVHLRLSDGGIPPAYGAREMEIRHRNRLSRAPPDTRASQDLFDSDGQVTYPLARSVIDGIGDGRRDRYRG